MVNSDLRPYYNPDTFDAGYLVIYKPGVGMVNPKTGHSLTSSIHPVVNTSGASGHYNPGANIGIRGMANINRDVNGFEKDYFNDLEFHEYFDLNNLTELFKNLFWNFFKNYCKILLFQPLEIARLVLQVGSFEFDKAKKKLSKSKLPRLLDESGELTPSYKSQLSDSESDLEINYFQSNPDMSSSSPSNSPKRLSTSEFGSPKKAVKSKRLLKRKHKIHPISKHTIDIVSAIAAKDGPNALFRGLNAQFIHQTLSHTIEAWITGFVSPFLGIPDPFFLDLTRLTEPLRSLCLSVLACVLTGIILMPLDLVKVRLMITQFNKPYNNEDDPELDNSTELQPPQSPPPPQSTRSIRESIRNYPVQLLIRPPVTVSFLTILHQFATSIFRKSAPYLLFIRFNIDSYLAPKLYTVSNLLLSIMEFFIKLPVENLLRKEQVRFLLTPKPYLQDPKRVVSIDNPDHDLIVEVNDSWQLDKPGKSNSAVTMWHKLVNLGLFNGWRVGVLNIIGFWGYKIVKSSGSLQEEKL